MPLTNPDPYPDLNRKPSRNHQTAHRSWEDQSKPPYSADLDSCPSHLSHTHTRQPGQLSEVWRCQYTSIRAQRSARNPSRAVPCLRPLAAEEGSSTSLPHPWKWTLKKKKKKATPTAGKEIGTDTSVWNGCNVCKHQSDAVQGKACVSCCAYCCF